MIVEDDPMVREINSKFLGRIEGFTLYKAVSNLHHAKKAMSIKKPDLILLDVYLPKENGIDFLKWIRGKEIDIDIILYGNREYHSDTLDIPHPRMHERDFVLQPLSDLAPDMVHPVLHKTVQQLLKEILDANRFVVKKVSESQ